MKHSTLKSTLHVRGPKLGPRTALLVSIGAAAVVALSAAVAWDGDVPQWELSILEFFNGWPDWLEPAMWFVQQPGVLLSPVVAGIVIVLATRRWHYMLPFVLLPAYKLVVEKRLVKPLVDRTRPFTSVGPEINARGDADLDGTSFPSGHATTAVATGLLIALFLPPKWRPLPIGWGVAVAMARLYFGEHNTLDVVAGAGLAVFYVTFIYVVFINRWVGDGPAGTSLDARSRPSREG